MGHFRGRLVFLQSQKAEDDIQREEERDCVFDPEDPVFTDVKVDRSKVHGCKARVGNDCQHEAIPKVKERIVRFPLKLVFERLFLLFARS